MKILFIVSSQNGVKALLGLSKACKRNKQSYICFFTGVGVKLLGDNEVLAVTKDAKKAVVCELSWEKHFSETKPPIEQGSQTDLCAMMGKKNKVISI